MSSLFVHEICFFLCMIALQGRSNPLILTAVPTAACIHTRERVRHILGSKVGEFYYKQYGENRTVIY